MWALFLCLSICIKGNSESYEQNLFWIWAKKEDFAGDSIFFVDFANNTGFQFPLWGRAAMPPCRL